MTSEVSESPIHFAIRSHPTVCALAACARLLQGRLRRDRSLVGRTLVMKDGHRFEVFRHVRLLQEQPRHPVVLPRVEGHGAEICPTVPARCIYWNLLRRRFKVFDRRDEPESARTNAC